MSWCLKFQKTSWKRLKPWCVNRCSWTSRSKFRSKSTSALVQTGWTRSRECSLRAHAPHYPGKGAATPRCCLSWGHISSSIMRALQRDMTRSVVSIRDDDEAGQRTSCAIYRCCRKGSCASGADVAGASAAVECAVAARCIGAAPSGGSSCKRTECGFCSKEVQQ